MTPETPRERHERIRAAIRRGEIPPPGHSPGIVPAGPGPAESRPGVGAHLKPVLARRGLAGPEGCGCGCADVAALLDRLGPDACEARRGELAGLLLDRARAGKVEPTNAAGRAALAMARRSPTIGFKGAWDALGTAIARARAGSDVES